MKNNKKKKEIQNLYLYTLSQNIMRIGFKLDQTKLVDKSIWHVLKNDCFNK